ncbi:MAG: phospho-sugar mutase [Clostridiales bacterium]|nr:phospho-sugar mutase [Clostridiales bacterium]
MLGGSIVESQALRNYKLWLEDPYIDEETKKELESIKDNKKEIEDSFFKDLEFGTAGLRGIIGAGPNRINKYVVRKTTQGLANYINTKGEEAKARGVVIAYDSRRMSREFAEEAACVLAGNDIKVYLFDDISPTPELSFAIRYLNCISGIVITASHNPAEYNGYKVYWEDGAQISTEQAQEITDEIDCVNDLRSIKMLGKELAKEKGLLLYLNEKIDNAYIEEVKKQSLRRDIVNKVSDEFKIVFTPLHGTGNKPVRRVLTETGFKNVIVVPEQEQPDPEFSTVKQPNPEDKDAFELAIELARKENANLIIGTDPDCDRVGAVVKDDTGEYIVLTGNQTGALLINYILETLKKNNNLPKNGVIIKTIVTSEMGANIAKRYGVETINTLTGFKYIGEKIKQFEKTDEKTFLFGYEESYGYLAGTYARDKDAVVASMLICEMVAYYYTKGMNLYDVLMDLYSRYGYFLEDLKSIKLEGKDGLDKIDSIMEYFRTTTIDDIGGRKVLYIEDYKSQRRIYMDGSNNVENIELPKANVVKFILENEGWVCLRPSGTEPKLKLYGGVKGSNLKESKEELAEIIAWVEEKIQEI